MLVAEKYAFAKVKISKNKVGVFSNKIEEIYTNKSLSYDPEMLLVGNLIYTFKYPLRCKFEKEDGFYTIQSEILEIIGTGQTEDEAELNFAQEFDYIYQRYNELEEKKLSEKLKFTKSVLNHLVLKVENI